MTFQLQCMYKIWTEKMAKKGLQSVQSLYGSWNVLKVQKKKSAIMVTSKFDFISVSFYKYYTKLQKTKWWAWLGNSVRFLLFFKFFLALIVIVQSSVMSKKYPLSIFIMKKNFKKKFACHPMHVEVDTPRNSVLQFLFATLL